MAGQNLMRSASGQAAGFLVGVVAGLFLKEAVQRIQERVRRKQTHLDYERTVSYDENLPDSLERREPAPEAQQPRFGGTGAIGFSPTAAMPGSRPPNGGAVALSEFSRVDADFGVMR